MLCELTPVDLGPLNSGPTAPPRDQWLKDVVYIGGFNGSGVYMGAAALGVQNPAAKDAKHLAKAGGKTVMVHELHYKVGGVSGDRWRRCFVAGTYMDAAMKPILLAAGASSTVVGADNARDMFQFPVPTSDIQFSWPIEVVRDNGIFAVLLDQAFYAPFNYTPANVIDPIIDHVAGIDAARYFLDNSPAYRLHPNAAGFRPGILPNIFVGGLSYGSVSSGFLAGVLKNCEGAYLAGAQVNKSQFNVTTKRFYPDGWIGNSYDFKDMWKASAVKKLRISFGQGDYTRENPSWTVASVDATCNDLVTFDPNRFSWRVAPNPPIVQGHEIDLPDVRSTFTSWINSLTAGERSFSFPKYEP